jgi:protein TonB
LASPTHGVEAPLAAVTRGATQRSSSPTPGTPKPTKNNSVAAALSLPSDSPRSQETKPGAPILEASAVAQQQPSAAATAGPDQPQSAATTIAAKPGPDSSSLRANATGGAIDGTGQGAARGTGSGTNIGSGTGSGNGGANKGESAILPFMDGMTRPQLLSMIEPEYTREARDANVKGLFVAKCVITTHGTLQRCRVVKGLPMMDQAVLAAIAQWRYSPVVYQGKPVAVDYVIQVRLAGH